MVVRGFPGRGGAGGGGKEGAILFFAKFFAENYMKKKDLDLEGACFPSDPFGAATATDKVTSALR